MRQHNDNISSIANVTLQDDQVVGASVNWYITSDPVPVEALHRAYLDQGLDVLSLPAPTSPHARLRQWCFYHDDRIYYHCPTLGERRQFVAAQVKHGRQDKHLVTYAYARNVYSGITERADLVQVGAITLDIVSGAVSWRFACDRSSEYETIHEYIRRAAAAQPEFTVDDLRFFAAHAEKVCGDIVHYRDNPCYDAPRMRDILRDEFERARCYLLSARGGFWFAPRHGADGGPYGRVAKVMRAFEASHPDNRFLLLTMPKDAATVETASTVVEEGLMSRVASIESDLDGLTAISRGNQHEGRLTELADTLERANLYRELLGLSVDSLQARIDAARQVIQAQIDAYEAQHQGDTKSEKRKARRQARKARAQAEVQVEPGAEAQAQAEPEAPAGPMPAGAALPTPTALGKLVKEAGIKGEAGLEVGAGVVLNVVRDPLTGYQWALVHADRLITQGAGSIQKACLASIRSTLG
jgi:hypothetical protein